MTTPVTTSANAATSTETTLAITGMTCAACAARIERKLNKLQHVTATVNYATEAAVVTTTDQAGVESAVTAIEALGFGAHLPADADGDADAGDEDTQLRSLRRRLVVAAVLAVPVIAVSMVPAWQFVGWQWVVFALTTPLYFYCGWPFHAGAVAGVRQRTTSMDTLVSLGTTSAFVWSVWAMLFGHAGMLGMQHEFTFGVGQGDAAGFIYFEAVAGIVLFLLLGRFFELRSRRASFAALSRGFIDVGRVVEVTRAGESLTVPVGALRVGDEFRVRPGEQVATDGVVVAGATSVNAAVMTGESAPVDVGVGDLVVGGVTNLTGSVVVRATAVGAGTQLARVERLLRDAQSAKASVQRLADAVSGVFVPVVLGIAGLTCVGWLVLGRSVAEAATATVAVLIIACPCALGLATPMALLVGTGVGARRGIVLRGAPVLEQARGITTVALDKTGTVTTGQMQVADVRVRDADCAQRVLGVAAGLETHSEHPIAAAIVAAAEAANVTVPDVQDFVAVPGQGVRGVVADVPVALGSPARSAALADTDDDVLGEFAEGVADGEALGHTCVVVIENGAAVGVIAVADQPKPDSAAAISRLKKLGLTPMLVTGDNSGAAASIARAVGIDHVHAGVTPEGKIDVIRDAENKGAKVAMIGDGVNDAAALATATLGIAVGAGSDVAKEAADITLLGNSLHSAVDAIRLSRRTLATIYGNLIWAFGYNIAAIPLAVGGFLTPMIAGAAMALSSAFVVANSLTLHLFRTK